MYMCNEKYQEPAQETVVLVSEEILSNCNAVLETIAPTIEFPKFVMPTNQQVPKTVTSVSKEVQAVLPVRGEIWQN